MISITGIDRNVSENGKYQAIHRFAMNSIDKQLKKIKKYSRTLEYNSQKWEDCMRAIENLEKSKVSN